MTRDLAETTLLALSSKILELEIKTKVLAELLIESKSVTKEKLDEKFEFIKERDLEKMKAELMELLDQYENAPVEYNESHGEWKDDPNKPWW